MVTAHYSKLGGNSSGPILLEVLLPYFCHVLLTYAFLVEVVFNYYCIFYIIKQALVFSLCFHMLVESMLFTVIIIHGKQSHDNRIPYRNSEVVKRFTSV